MIELTVTKSIVEEIALCIVHNELDENEACDYAWAVVCEHNTSEVVEV